VSALVERDAALARLQADIGRGRVALVAGEAGIGKTSLLRVLAAAHGAHGPVWWGACDALDTPHPLAPLVDIAREAAPAFVSALAGPRPALFEAVLDALRSATQPVLVVVEDAHWADDATLDLLKFLGRRVARTRALLAVSYRDDEVTASHPLRRVIGELPPESLTRVLLPRLTPSGVQQLAQQMGRRAEGVHALTRGNAFFVTEVLRDTAEPRGPVPATVQDVVLARFARLPPRAQTLLRAVAVVPGRVENWLVNDLVAPALDDVEAALASGLLVADGDSLAFRHELGRVAVEAALPPPVAQALHGQVLAALSAASLAIAPARLAHHALLSRDASAVARFAPLAALEASARGAEREAAAQWHAALRHGAPPSEAQHVDWLERHARACAVVGRTADALASRRELERRQRARGDLAAAALQLSQQAGLVVRLMQHDEADALSQQALALLAPLEPGQAHATVWRAEATLRMYNRDGAQGAHWARRAADLAHALGDELVYVEALGTMGTAMLFTDYAQGVTLMQRAVALHEPAGRRQQQAQLYGNLGSGSGELMQLVPAQAWLEQALAIAVRHEIDSLVHYVHSWLALVTLYRGEWDETGRWADDVLHRDGMAPMSRLMALLAVARLRIRRGDPGADDALAEGLALTGEHNTLQRMGPLRAARAEAAFARGDLTSVRAEVAAALPLAQAKAHPWFIGELAYWRWRCGDLQAPPEGAAEPFALEMAGRWQAAAGAWAALDCPYEQARALAGGDAAAQQQALAIFDRLGARPAADALRRRLQAAGVRGVQRGARASTRAQPCGLTTAEMGVLALMVQGLRNAEIAAQLHRSVRTVDHHVAAVLAKLGVQTRLAAVRQAEREGWFADGDAPAGQSAQSAQSR